MHIVFISTIILEIIFAFFLAGPTANLLLAACGAVLHYYEDTDGLSILLINTLLFFVNILPGILPQNDLNQFLSYFKACRKIPSEKSPEK